MSTIHNSKYQGPSPRMFSNKNKIVIKFALVDPDNPKIDENLSWYSFASAEFMKLNYFPELEILEYEKEIK